MENHSEDASLNKTLGNMGRVTLDPPGTWQFDLALARIFQIKEKQQLEFRVEAYNVTNSFRPGNPVTNLNSNQFGQIITSLDPRILQFALKYVFLNIGSRELRGLRELNPVIRAIRGEHYKRWAR